MKVQGHQVTEAQLKAADEAMTGFFRAAQITDALVAAGVPREGYVAGRVADSVLQKARREGRISYSVRGWKRT